MLKKQVAVELMKHLVNHNWHGYSQYSRWGDGEGTCDVVVDGKTYKVKRGDRDCSSAIISAYEAAGISCGGATYTGNMRACMCAAGNFRWHPMSSGYIAQAGDIYLNEACHTAMCLSAQPDLLMEFSISETGGIDGAEGDQTGWESHTCAYYNYPWDGILECINTESASGSSGTAGSKKPKQIPGNAANNHGLYYRTHVQDLGWLDPVHDGQVSGTTGYGKQVEALKIDTRKLPGVTLNVKAHIQDIGWKLYKDIRHDTVIGTVGKNKRIEAIEIEASGLPAGKKLLYRTHSANVGWTGWIEAGFTTGSVGMKRAIEAIQIKITP